MDKDKITKQQFANGTKIGASLIWTGLKSLSKTFFKGLCAILSHLVDYLLNKHPKPFLGALCVVLSLTLFFTWTAKRVAIAEEQYKRFKLEERIRMLESTDRFYEGYSKGYNDGNRVTLELLNINLNDLQE